MMKSKLLIVFLLVATIFVQAQDSVSELTARNQMLMREGLAALYQRHIAELETIRDSSMAKKDLTLANKADDEIKNTKAKIAKIDSAVPALSPLPSTSKDSVDVLNSKYQKLIRNGMIALYKRHVAELEKMRDSAMAKKNLTLANDADAKIKSLKMILTDLTAPEMDSDDKNQKYPANEFYKMTSTTPRLGSEKGREIICEFARLRESRLIRGTISLTLISANTKYADTPNDIFILKRSHGKQVGKLGGIGTGKTRKIPLSLKASDTLEIVIVVKGGDAIHLKPFSEGVPELYLTIEE